MFDESHAMANAAGGKGERGDQAPSQQGRAGLRLQHALPNARVAVMGGPQAAMTLSTVRRNQIERSGGEWSAEEQEAFEAPVRDQFEEQSHCYYSSARLWDDGVIDPADTRRILGMALEVAAHAPIPEPRYGIFRM